MSLVNDMLRELDRRKGAGELELDGVELMDESAARSGRGRLWLLVGLLVVVVAGAALYQWGPWERLLEGDAGSTQVAEGEDGVPSRVLQGMPVAGPGEVPRRLVDVMARAAESGPGLQLYLRFTESTPTDFTMNNERTRLRLVARATEVAAVMPTLMEHDWIAGSTLMERGEDLALELRFRRPVAYRAWREDNRVIWLELHPEEAPPVVASAPKPEPTARPQPREREATPPPRREPATRGAFQRSPSEGGGGQRARRLVAEGNERLAAGESGAAARAYRAAIEADPDYAEARVQYAFLLADGGRLTRAREILAEGLARDPGARDMARIYAGFSLEVGDTDGARLALEGARRDQEPGNVEVDLAALYRQIGLHAEAAELYGKLAEAQPHNGLWVAGMAMAAEGLGEEAVALANWRRALNHRGLPDEVVAYARTRIERLAARVE